MSIVEPVMRRMYRAPTARRYLPSKQAAYRAEAQARFRDLCNCAEIGAACSYHDQQRWDRTGMSMSRNSYVVRRWACMLAARDGVYLAPPVKPISTYSPPSTDDLPF